MLDRGRRVGSLFYDGTVRRMLMGQVVCIWCKTRSSVWRRRVFWYGWSGGVVLIMVVDSNRDGMYICTYDICR